MLRPVLAAQLLALAALSLVLTSIAEAQSANPHPIEPFAAEQLNQERQIQGYELGQPTRSRSPRARTEHFAYRPTIDGISLLNAAIAIHIDDIGHTIRSTANGLPREPRSRTFSITREQASDLAAKAVGASPNATVHAQQVYFVAPLTTDPAWQVYVETPREGAYEVVISAATGEPLRVTPLTHDAASSGSVFRAPDAANPSIASRTLEPLSGWSSAEGACPADVYPAGSNGECWSDGAASVGNNVDACLDVDADNICDRRALGSAGLFTSLFVDSYDQAGNPIPDRDAALVNAFYWVNALHDWLYRLGFDEASGNFQLDNFGRGGQQNDSVRVDVQDGAVVNNATFSTPPDGIAPRMQLGLYSWSRRDAAFDGDILVHEYVHGVTNRLVGGAANVAALSIWQSGALGEGWSDALAASFIGDPIFGEYVSNNPASGLRTAALHASPYTFGRLGSLNGAVHGPTGRILPLPEVHADGEIWAATLWNIRQHLGKEDFEQTLIDALKLTPSRPSMIDARDAFILSAELLDLDFCSVWSAFATGGLGVSAALNSIEDAQPNDTALSVFESFDRPVACGGSAPVATVNLHSEDAESASSWTGSGLWHRSTRRSSTGSYAWWFGQEGTVNYDTGSRTAGDLISPPVDLTGFAAAMLSWEQYFRGEGFNSRIDLGGLSAPFLNADSGRVWASTDNGASWLLITHVAHDTPGAGFASFRVNLTRFAGSVIRLRFDFDTFSAAANNHEGWFIDDIRVDALSTEPPTIELNPTSLAFNGTAGAVSPAALNLEIEVTGVGDLSWSAGIASGAPWLSIDQTAGSGTTTLTATVDASGLAAGAYSGSIEVATPGNSPVVLPVLLNLAVPPGPVASWSFEETASGPGVTVNDASGNGLQGTTAGRGSAAVTGPVGNGRVLNGFSDSIVMPASAIYTPQQFTVRAWVRLDAYPSALGVIVSTFSGGASTGWYLAVNAAGKPIFMPASPPTSSPWLMGSTSLQLGRWYYLAAAYDRSTNLAAIYVDGQLQGSLQAPGLASSTATQLTIGKASWTDSYRLRGAVDEISIVPYLESTFSLAEAFSSAAPPAASDDAAVAGEWAFDASAIDASGNGHSVIVQASDFGPGMLGNGLRFDGFNDSAAITADERFSPASFTIRAWVRLLALPQGWGALLSNYDGAFSGWYLGLLGDGRPFFGLASLPTNLPSVVASQSLVIGQWTQLTTTYEGGSRTLSLYVNGVLAASRQTLGFTPRASGQLVLGKASWIDAHHSAFDIDELQILTRSLTAQAVLADAQSYTGSHEAALAHWTLDEAGSGPGTVFADSARGHDSTTAANRNTPMTGVSNVARRFEGYPDYATVAPHSDFSSPSFSFSTWIRLDESLDKWGVVFSTYDGISAGWYLALSADRRPILSVSGTPGSSPWVLASQSLTLGRWQHLAVTFEGRERRGIIYIDGVRSASAVFPAWTPSTGISPHFGRASWSNGAYVRYFLDDPTLYGHELTGAEVVARHALHSSRQTPQPLARWEFESTAGDGTMADSAGMHTATSEGRGGAQVSGVSGTFAHHFPGNPNAARVQPHADFASNAFTFSAWVKTSSAPTAWGMIFSNYDGANRGWYLALNTDNRLIFSVSGLPSSNPWLLSSAPITPGLWTHIAVTFDGVNRRGVVYLDGVVVATAVFPAWTPQSSVGPTFARASWDFRYYLDVSIDDARYCDLDLSAPEIADLVAEH
ncbi:MAG: M36 family metallopeptidase [Acidobacteria bacterium]|nr:M36 family metallopeptidase [Acidobacteriota bacterium]